MYVSSWCTELETVAAQQLTKDFCINHIPSMARHTRDLPEQKNAAQMQVITIKVFVAALQNTSGIYITISQETTTPSSKFRMEGSTELRAGAKYVRGFLLIFSSQDFC